QLYSISSGLSELCRMMDGASNKAVRPSKRDAIVIKDEESTSDQPLAKSARRAAESVPSSEVVNLRKEVDKYQDACIAAKTDEIEFLKSLLDTTEKKDGEMTMEMEKNELAWENEVLTKEIDLMKEEHNDKMASLLSRASDSQTKDNAR
ncbi:hypothetical protein PENTCL1PPCAC_24228, partial [Pristionchus entomophagus]